MCLLFFSSGGTGLLGLRAPGGADGGEDNRALGAQDPAMPKSHGSIARLAGALSSKYAALPSGGLASTSHGTKPGDLGTQISSSDRFSAEEIWGDPQEGVVPHDPSRRPYRHLRWRLRVGPAAPKWSSASETVGRSVTTGSPSPHSLPLRLLLLEIRGLGG
jgi:hypothetical protein